MQSVERRKARPERRLEIPDAALPGFYLIVQPSGQKSWAVRYRAGGRTRKFTIGPYPRFDLAAARSAAREALQLASLGRDPAEEKRAGMIAAAAAERDTVRAVVDLYVARHIEPNSKPRYAAEAKALLQNHVVARWGPRRIGTIGRADVNAMTDALTDAGMKAGANRIFAAARALFNFAVERELIPTTPFLKMRLPVAEASRERVLDDDEVRLLWKACATVGYPFGTMVRLLLLTGQGRDEVAQMVRSEVAGALWTIPARRTKNSREHVVPLSPEASDLLAKGPAVAGKAGYVFTNSGEAAASNYAKSKAKLDAAMLALARERAAQAGEDAVEVRIDDWRLHDLRRTAASGMARLGTPVHVVEAVLNHRSGRISGVAAIYNRHQYFDEKRAALEAWGHHVAALMGAKQ